ncbi:MAG TPA: ABC transporter ATP-binding protein [Candidatus Babeliales bacterium]|nr:ABC transporter ATP-binding protein [Candidatus Babeliales bacterium]
MHCVLQVRQLTKIFHSSSWFKKGHPFVAVDQISFSIEKGEILGLLGPNGAGKSTTMQMLLGTLTPTGGSISYFGQNFATHQATVMEKIGYATGYAKLPSKFTVWENLRIIGKLYGLSAEQARFKSEELLSAFNVSHLLDRYTGGLSAGQMTRVMLTKAFLSSPELVLLDEPTASLDPDVVESVRYFLLDQQKKSNVSILLASHDMNEVAHVCDRVLVLKQGTIIAHDTPDKLAATVSKSRVKITIVRNLPLLIDELEKQGVQFVVHDHDLDITIDEQAISGLFSTCSRLGVSYSHIAIEKPTLEDYFLTIARKNI